MWTLFEALSFVWTWSLGRNRYRRWSSKRTPIFPPGYGQATHSSLQGVESVSDLLTCWTNRMCPTWHCAECGFCPYVWRAIDFALWGTSHQAKEHRWSAEWREAGWRESERGHTDKTHSFPDGDQRSVSDNVSEAILDGPALARLMVEGSHVRDPKWNVRGTEFPSWT